MAYLFNDATPDSLRYDTGTIINAYPFTMSAWSRPDAAVAGELLGIGDKDASIANVNLLHLDTGAGDIFHHTYGSGNAFAITTNTSSLNVWSHIVGTVVDSGATRDLISILNGDTANKGTDSGTPGTFTGNDSIWVGRALDTTPSAPYSGYIAEVAIWNVELNADELAALALGYSPLLIRPGSLIFYAPLHNNTIDLLNPGRTVTTGGSPTASPGVHPPMIYPAHVQVPVATPAGLTLPIFSGDSIHGSILRAA